MAINERLIHTAAEAAAAGNEAEQGLILHLDANDVDSYDGDGSVWYDISTHDVTVPLSDNADNLKIHYNPSDPDSYSGSGTTLNNLAGNTLDATVVASRYDIDNGGFFDVSLQSENTIGVPDGHPLDGTGNSFTLEFWFNWKSAPSGGERFIYEASTGWNFFYYAGYGWRINNADCATGYFSNNVATAAGEWNHFAMSQDASNCKVYLNGTLVKTQAVTSGTRDVGSFSFGSTSLDGVNCKIGAIRMYNAALSASDVGQNYRHGRDYIYTDLIDDTDLELHLDAASFPQKGESGYSNTPTTWTALTGSNGTITGATFDSELGNYISFDGTDDYMTLSGSNSLTNRTIEFWYKTNDKSDNRWVFDAMPHYSPPNAFGSWGVYLDSSNIYFVGAKYNGSTYGGYQGSSSVITEGKWHHIAFSCSNGSYKGYVDGELIPQGSNSAYSTSRNVDPVVLTDVAFMRNRFGYSSSIYYAEGDLGQIRVYDTVLSQDDIRQNFNFTKNDYPNGYNGDFNGLSSSDWNSNGYFDFPTGSDRIDLDYNGIGKDNTLVMWVNLGANTTIDGSEYRYQIYSQYSGSDYAYLNVQLADNTTGGVHLKVLWRHTSSSYYFTEDDIEPPFTNGWNMVAIYVTGNKQVYYSINGNNWSQATTWIELGTTDEVPKGNVILSGYRGNTSITTQLNPFSMSQLKIYDKVLTNSELSALNTAGYQG